MIRRISKRHIDHHWLFTNHHNSSSKNSLHQKPWVVSNKVLLTANLSAQGCTIRSCQFQWFPLPVAAHSPICSQGPGGLWWEGEICQNWSLYQLWANENLGMPPYVYKITKKNELKVKRYNLRLQPWEGVPGIVHNAIKIIRFPQRIHFSGLHLQKVVFLTCNL